MKNQPEIIKYHENQARTMKNQPGTIKSHENRPRTMKTNLEPWKTMKTAKELDLRPLAKVIIFRDRQTDRTFLLYIDIVIIIVIIVVVEKYDATPMQGFPLF